MTLTNTLYFLKATAIITVALAHSYYTELPYPELISILARISRLGVFVFFFLAGYFFHISSHFVSKKFLRIGVPWIVCACIMYGYQCAHLHHAFTGMGLINYFIGNGTYLYFLSVLCGCYVLCWPCHKYPVLLVVYILALAISSYLTDINVFSTDIHPDQWFFCYLNPYLNVFNWVGIFALGLWFQLSNKLEQLAQFTRAYAYVLIPLYLLFIWLINKYDTNTQYWSYSVLVGNCLGLCALLGCCQYFTPFHYFPSACIRYIGAHTLPIYLYHMMIINKILTYPPYLKYNWLAGCIRPVLCVVICAGVFWATGKVIQKLCPKMYPVYQLCFGIK